MDDLDLVREFLLRLPPDDPSSLFRASLVCRAWRSILSSPAFTLHYRAFHRPPPLLGVFQNVRFYDENDEDDDVLLFIPTVDPSPLPPPPDLEFLRTMTVMDCRHGLLLLRFTDDDDDLVVWDPVARLHFHLPSVPEGPFRRDYFSAAVMCAAPECAHLDCRESPVRVVLAGTDSTDEGSVVWVSSYSSENHAWTASNAFHLGPPITDASNAMGPLLLAGGSLYFILDHWSRIVRYALDGEVLSEIGPPPSPPPHMVLMAMEHGILGAAGVVNYHLHIWWRWSAAATDADAWVLYQIISLATLITLRINNPETVLYVIGFAEMGAYLFLSTHDSIYSLDLKSGRLERIRNNGTYLTVFPYECFCTL